MTHPLASDAHSKGLTLGLWAGVLGPPTLWALRFAVAYAVVPWVCGAGAIAFLHATTMVTMAGTVGLGWRSRRYWRGSRRGLPGTVDEAVLKRIRFMALLGMMSAALFTVAVAAEGIASLMIDPCLTAGPLVPH